MGVVMWDLLGRSLLYLPPSRYPNIETKEEAVSRLGKLSHSICHCQYHNVYKPSAFSENRFSRSTFSQEHAPVTLTKDHLIESIRNRLGISKLESTRILESFLETIKSSLSNGEDVLFSGFRKFIVKEKAARRGRNPATGEDLTLDPRRAITFKCSPVIRDRINGGS